MEDTFGNTAATRHRVRYWALLPYDDGSFLPMHAHVDATQSNYADYCAGNLSLEELVEREEGATD